MNMKIFKNNFTTLTSMICCWALTIIILFPSCNPTSNISSNSGSGLLDPIVAKNTTPKDTSKTGYTAITKSNTVTPPKVEPKIDSLYWCDTLPYSALQQVVICFEKIGNRPIKADTTAYITINQNSLFPTIEIDSSIQQKSSYKVVVIMPFMSQNFVPAPGREIPPHSVKSIEFYEGVLIALDSLKEQGLSLFVSVFDSQRDTSLVEELLLKKELKEADLIIGPLSSADLQLVAEFGKNNQKAIVSPFNPIPGLTSENPYFIQINPSFQVHSDQIIKNLNKIAVRPEISRVPMQQNLLILALENDSTKVTTLQKSYAFYQKDTAAKITQILRKNASIDINTLRPYFKKDQLNIVIIPNDSDEGFVYNSLREIQKLVDIVEPRKGYQIAIVGMDIWKYYERINFQYFEAMNLHLSSEYFYDENSKRSQVFKENYKAIYGISAREFSFIGFDVMLYFGQMLQKYGTHFAAHLWKEQTQLNHTKFEIEPNLEIISPLDGINPMGRYIFKNYENKYTNFLKYENYQFRRIN